MLHCLSVIGRLLLLLSYTPEWNYFGMVGSSTTSLTGERIRRLSTDPDQVIPGAIVTVSVPSGVKTFTTNGIGVSFLIVASILLP